MIIEIKLKVLKIKYRFIFKTLKNYHNFFVWIDENPNI